MKSRMMLALGMIIALLALGLFSPTSAEVLCGTPAKPATVEVVEHDAVPAVTKVVHHDAVPAVAGQWWNWSPNHDQGPFEGPPSFPTDERGTWEGPHDVGGPSQDLTGTFQQGNGNGSWFHREPGTPEIPASDETIVVTPAKDAYTERIEHAGTPAGPACEKDQDEAAPPVSDDDTTPPAAAAPPVQAPAAPAAVAPPTHVEAGLIPATGSPVNTGLLMAGLLLLLAGSGLAVAGMRARR